MVECVEGAEGGEEESESEGVGEVEFVGRRKGETSTTGSGREGS